MHRRHPRRGLRESLDALRAAIGRYTVQLLAHADTDGALARRALGPSDEFRALASRRRSLGAALPPGAPAPTAPPPA